MDREAIIKRLVELVFLLSDELEKVEDVDPNDLWPLHPDRKVTPKFAQARPYVDEIVDLVRSANGDQLSDHIILVKLLYNVAAIRIQLKINNKELRELAERNAAELIHYKATRDVDIPLVSLKVEPDPFEFGPVVFIPIHDDDKQTDWWKQAQSSLPGSSGRLLLSYARVNERGDLHMSVRYARATIKEALLLLRGIGFLLVEGEQHQFGLINEFPLWGNVPHRLGNAKETTHVDARSELVTTLGPPTFPYDLRKDILAHISPDRLKQFLELLKQVGLSPSGEMQARLLLGLRWLGEATKPDILGARFAKVAFALEALIGGEANEEYLSTRGITATLAERAAFLTSDDPDSRLETDKNIRKYYALRSSIAHGQSAEVRHQDLRDFFLLVREIAWSLLEKIDHFSDLVELQRWVVGQRYD